MCRRTNNLSPPPSSKDEYVPASHSAMLVLLAHTKNMLLHCLAARRHLDRNTPIQNHRHHDNRPHTVIATSPFPYETHCVASEILHHQ